MDATPLRIVVIGGGISGLSAALRVQELGRERGLAAEVRLLEAGPKLGGQILTERVGGLLLEAGPDQFVAHKPAGLELCRRLGLESEIVQLRATGPTLTQVVHRGRLARLPAGTSILVPTRLGPLFSSQLFSWRGKARIACEPLVPGRPADLDDESLSSFFTRRFGREFLERVAEPILAGIHMADADTLSLEMTLPRLLQLERSPGRVLGALRSARKNGAPGRSSEPSAWTAGGFISLKGGLGCLVERVASMLAPRSILAGTAACSVGRGETGPWQIELARGGRIDADAVVLACPAYAAAALLRWRDDRLSSELGRLAYASCATVNLAYRRELVGRIPSSFGFFVPRGEGLPLLACSHVGLKFPDRAPGELVLLRAFLGGARHPEILQLDDQELAGLADRTLRRLLEIRGEPGLQRTYRFVQAMPQFAVGHRTSIGEISGLLRGHPGLFVCGGSMGAVGIPDCVESGERSAAQALEFAVATQHASWASA